MKQIFPLALLWSLIYSCTKSEIPQPLSEIHEVSGRISRITGGIPGSHKSTTTLFEYDIQSRIKHYSTFSVDSSLSNTIIAADYILFNYNGIDPWPASSVRTNNNNTLIETTTYEYDIARRIKSETTFINSYPVKVNEYSYYTLSYIRTTSSGISMAPISKDTIWLDSLRNILKMNTHELGSTSATRSVQINYDNKKNPAGETNLGNFFKSYYGTTHDLFFLSPNNPMEQSGDISGLPYNTVYFYKYSSNGYPIQSTMANNYIATFEYE